LLINSGDHHPQKLRLVKSPQALLTALLLAFTCLTFCPANAAVEEIPLDPENGIASGASLLGGTFNLLGIPSVGLFVGNPNELPRADRVLMTFPVDTLLRMVKDIRSAKLVFYEEYFFGEAEQREIELAVFDRDLGELSEESLASSEVTPVATISISPAGQTKGGQATPEPYEMDVTKALIASLKAGATTISFRLRDIEVEENGNNERIAEGFTIDKRPSFLPFLRVESKK